MNSISTKTVNKIKFYTNKIERVIFNPDKQKRPENYYDVDIGFKKGGIKIPISLKYLGNKENYVLNYFDREVHTAIVALYLAGNKCISPSMIFRVLCGNNSNSSKSARISDNNSNNIIESINRMRNTSIEIGTSSMNKDFSYSGVLLPCEIDNAVINGHKSQNCIYFDESNILPLFKYGEVLKQIENIDINLVNIDRNSYINNYENTVLKFYLLRRILDYKRSTKKLSNSIIVENLYKILDISNKFSGSNLNHKRTRIVNIVKTCMEFWKGQNFIKYYSIERASSDSKIIFKL